MNSYNYDLSTVVTIIKTTIKTFEANIVLSNTLISNTITALYNNSLCEDYRINVNLFKKDYNKDNLVSIQVILIAVEKKYISLKVKIIDSSIKR